MRAAKFEGNDTVHLVEKPTPAVGPEEVLLKIAYCGLCGSDKRIFHNGHQVTPGHELSGTVVARGSQVENLAVGTKGIVYIPLFCGKCPECTAGFPNRCETKPGLVGWQVDGGYAEYIAIPARNLIPLPEDIDLKEGVLLLDTVSTPAHGIRLCLMSFGQKTPPRAAVLGCGPLGLGSLLVLKAMGIPEIYAYDISPTRMAVAEQFGAQRLDPGGAAFQDAIPLILEASGSLEARAQAFDLVKAGGAILLLGENNSPWTITPTPRLRRKDCAYIRSFYFLLSEMEANYQLFRNCRADFNQLITKIGLLDEIEQFHLEFCRGETIKPMIRLDCDN
ncbi:MAG: alcohol dehydrogenase catalytic domain-containing protein [Negativicutes bacterium]|nr:alcohol dehydrogenase catalytic domain-containing protein [Negativicutes bacterium]